MMKIIKTLDDFGCNTRGEKDPPQSGAGAICLKVRYVFGEGK